MLSQTNTVWAQVDTQGCRRDGVDPVRQGLIEKVRAIHRRTRGSYGSRRMAKALQREGHTVGRQGVSERLCVSHLVLVNRRV